MFSKLKSYFALALKSDKGFTLIELFTAIVLLTIGLLGTAALTAGVVRGNSAAKNQTTASAIAQSCFQENRRVGYTNAGTSNSGNGCPVGTATVVLGGVSFTRVLEAIDTSATNMKTLTVTVSWSEGTAGSRSISMKTSMASGT
jgi:prepilin-type N-terminal cleavage/methylation domain-containing protein